MTGGAKLPPASIPEGAALVVLGPGKNRGVLELAARLKDVLPGAEIHGLRGRVNSAGGADVAFADVASHIRGLFEEGRPVVGLCAAGILIRALAGVLGDKRAEPPVVAVAADGSTAGCSTRSLPGSATALSVTRM